MSDEVIDIDTKSIDERKSREERKANGRYAAVIIAVIIILLAIYHAWIRKTAVLAGILVPALIMILYGGWVIFLTKRDKKRRQLVARQMEENARLELAEQAASVAALKITKTNEKRKHHNSSASTVSSSSKKNTTTNVLVSASSGAAGVAVINADNSCPIRTGEALTRSNLAGEKHFKRKHKRRRPSISQVDGTDKTTYFRQRFLRSNPQAEIFRKTNKNQRIPPFLCRTNSAP